MSFLPVHPNPKKPDFILPAKACDAHCHVFGPADQFPYAPERKYTPVDAPKEQLFALHKHLGFERSVLVQASCHGTDNSAMIDMLEHGEGRYRGVAVVGEELTREEVQRMHEAGVRGIRFNFVKRLVDVKPAAFYHKMAELIAPFGWHIIVYFESQELPDIASLLMDLPTPIAIDHMGRPDVDKGMEHPDFERICELVAQRPDTWVKVGCLERITRQEPPYLDVIPFARHFVETFPDQVLWGTDWPHPNMKSHMPDDGALVDSIPLIAPTAELQQKLLVDNPARLYEFED
ncbi:amidohydrolase family protein [Pseudomaricurvus alkylphenolicus]|uniref:amidohydrolase family protein n=1 Tax=Pseudomaricurvus alkylphenolicus TaxID=1306991 RepID=UPI001422F5A8|nr:amidohydrolase family protein [Pseudomaricurvus alkylphenolicus]NIB38511.1 amidohydrolase family protein [Pseudomaricurvus alkylphenolicus]